MHFKLRRKKRNIGKEEQEAALLHDIIAALLQQDSGNVLDWNVLLKDQTGTFAMYL